MKNINFTDWHDLWLKKDVEGISKKISNSPIFNIIILVDIVIAIFTLAFGLISIIRSDEKYIIIIYILLGLSIILPILIYFSVYLYKRHKASDKVKKGKMDVKYYIDIFDNKIGNCIMMANSLCLNISTDNKNEENHYLICETSYYINKCIKEFVKMGGIMLEQIFVKNDNTKIAPHRLLLVINLIKTIRNEINDFINKHNIKNTDIISHIIDENKNEDIKLNDFITEINQSNIGITCLHLKFSEM